MTEELQKPCKEFPFRRRSAPGYLGAASYQPEDFLAPHWYGQVHLPCHMTVDWRKTGDDREAAIESAPACDGFARMCANSCKMPHNQQDAERVAAYMDSAGDELFDDPDVFKWYSEFVEHHRDPHSEDAEAKQYEIRSKLPETESEMVGVYWIVQVINGYEYLIDQFSGTKTREGSIDAAKAKAEQRLKELRGAA